jgi:tetratricopeptide (TPR) repeat protein
MIKRVATVLAVFLAASSVRAEECPRDAPEDSGLRRMLAKKWFSKGETEAKAGNDVAAMKDYQCSLMFVPHGFTAYNIGQLAEKTGDLEVAIASFGQYLLLVPDAKDAKEIGERVETLKDRLAKVRDSDRGLGGNGNEPPLEHLMEKTQEESFPEAAQPLVPEPSTLTPGVSSESGPRKAPKYRTAGWITAGGGAVLVLGGVLSNVLARGQMDTCRSEYKKGNQSSAESACSNATPLAYLSYGLIGVGAAAVVTGAVLMFVRPREPDDVAVNVLPEGGLSLHWSGRF